MLSKLNPTPNPVSSLAHTQVGKMTTAITDINGRVVFARETMAGVPVQISREQQVGLRVRVRVRVG